MDNETTGIDLTLICGRRPELLSETLRSFTEKMFQNFTINNVIVNLDPFGGDERDHTETINIINSFFSNAHVIQPQIPSFGRAVQQAWLHSKSDFIFHLEDDWVLEEKIHPKDIFPIFDEDSAALQFVCAEHNWDGQRYKIHKKKFRILGIPISTREDNVFGTSPGFWRGQIARTVASLLNPDLDPEKQMRRALNPPLFKFLKDHKCRMLSGTNDKMLITDIGRAWRSERGIIKKTEKGKSIWTCENQ